MINTSNMKRLKPVKPNGRRKTGSSLENFKRYLLQSWYTVHTYVLMRLIKLSTCRMSLFQEVCQWANSVLSQSSLHAVGWITRVHNPMLKTLFFCVVLLIMIALPMIAAHTIMGFYSNIKVTTSVEYMEALSMSYPNVTICNPKFFDIRKFKSKYCGILFFGLFNKWKCA